MFHILLKPEQVRPCGAGRARWRCARTAGSRTLAAAWPCPRHVVAAHEAVHRVHLPQLQREVGLGRLQLPEACLDGPVAGRPLEYPVRQQTENAHEPCDQRHEAPPVDQHHDPGGQKRKTAQRRQPVHPLEVAPVRGSDGPDLLRVEGLAVEPHRGVQTPDAHRVVPGGDRQAAPPTPVSTIGHDELPAGDGKQERAAEPREAVRGKVRHVLVDHEEQLELPLVLAVEVEELALAGEVATHDRAG